MSLSFEAKATNKNISYAPLPEERDIPFDALAQETLEVAVSHDTAPEVNEADYATLNVSQQAYLEQVHEALHAKNQAEIDRIDHEIKDLNLQILDYEAILTRAKRARQGLRAEFTDAQRQAKEKEAKLLALSERVREVSALIKELNIEGLLEEYDTLETEIHTFFAELNIGPHVMNNAGEALEKRKQRWVAEGQELQSHLQHAEQELIKLKDELLNDMISEARRHGIEHAIYVLKTYINETNEEINRVNARIETYENYGEKLERLREIDAQTEKIHTNYSALETELHNLYGAISELTGMPLYQVEEVPTTPGPLPLMSPTDHLNTQRQEYSDNPLPDIVIPRLSVVQSGYRAQRK